MPTDQEYFEKWLDGEAVDEKEIERWAHDESLKAHYETGLYLKHHAQCFEQQEVPQWNREATFGYEQQKRDWFSWLNVSPALSMAMSVAAIFMVLFKVEVQVNDDGLLLSFAADHKQQLMDQMDEKLAQFGRDQQLIMANYVDDIQAQQKQDVAQLTGYLVRSARQERREEMTELVQYLNARRDDDMTLQKFQMDKILYQYSQQNTESAIKRTSYQPGSNNLTHQEDK